MQCLLTRMTMCCRSNYCFVRSLVMGAYGTYMHDDGVPMSYGEMKITYYEVNKKKKFKMYLDSLLDYVTNRNLRKAQGTHW